MKIFFHIPMVCNLLNHIKSVFFFFHQESLHKNQHIYFSSRMQIEFRSDEIPQGMFQGQHLVHEFQQAWIQRPTDKCNQLIVREIMAGF